MVKQLIDGVMVKQLRAIPDERGWLMEMFRSDWPEFERFGQMYITSCYSGVIKAWHYHRKQADHFVCIRGMAKVVLYDNRPDSPTKGLINEFFMGERNPLLLKIPPLVYHGFKGISDGESWIINVPTELYNYEEPDEYRLPYDTEDIPYDWDIRMG
ncbi:MAG: dTDP-4-dehydrorhamnose 3,5-epimerase [Euryarchaeota archaeon]|nr:dTDP-4-dehydrorhamnose 3,5-epimerase [Euryarchaeota archaeon]